MTDPTFTANACWRSGPDQYRYARTVDIPAIAEMLSDPEVARWLWFTPIDAAGVDAFFRPLLEAQATALGSGSPSDSLVFAIEDAESGAFYGMGAVEAVPASPGGFEIGYQLPQVAWGRGTGTRLSRFLTRFAIDHLDAFRIEAAPLEGNTASVKILRNLGLNQEARFVDYRLRDGVRHTELRFGARVSDLDRSVFPPVDRVE